MSLIAWRKYQAGLRNNQPSKQYGGMLDGLSLGGFQDIPGYQMPPMTPWTPIPFTPTPFTPSPYPGSTTPSPDSTPTVTEYLSEPDSLNFMDTLTVNKLTVQKRAKIPCGTDMYDAV